MEQKTPAVAEDSLLRTAIGLAIGYTAEEVDTYTTEELARICTHTHERREISNALTDFVTITLTTKLIGPYEDHLRTELLKIPHLLDE